MGWFLHKKSGHVWLKPEIPPFVHHIFLSYDFSCRKNRVDLLKTKNTCDFGMANPWHLDWAARSGRSKKDCSPAVGGRPKRRKPSWKKERKTKIRSCTWHHDLQNTTQLIKTTTDIHRSFSVLMKRRLHNADTTCRGVLSSHEAVAAVQLVTTYRIYKPLQKNFKHHYHPVIQHPAFHFTTICHHLSFIASVSANPLDPWASRSLSSPSDSSIVRRPDFLPGSPFCCHFIGERTYWKPWLNDKSRRPSRYCHHDPKIAPAVPKTIP